MQLNRLERKDLHNSYVCQSTNNDVVPAITSSVTLDLNCKFLKGKILIKLFSTFLSRCASISASINNKIRSRCEIFIGESFIRFKMRGDGITPCTIDIMVEGKLAAKDNQGVGKKARESAIKGIIW